MVRNSRRKNRVLAFIKVFTALHLNFFPKKICGRTRLFLRRIRKYMVSRHADDRDIDAVLGFWLTSSHVKTEGTRGHKYTQRGVAGVEIKSG